MMDWLLHHKPMLMFGVAGIVLIAFFIYSATRPEEDEYEDDDEIDGEGLSSTMKMSGSHAADTGELLESVARKSRMLALKDSLDRSLQTRAGVRASDLDRQAMPWFMLVGTEGSGKKSLLASTGLPLPFGAPVEVDSVRKDAGRWWLFEQAVVVEAPTAKAAPKPVAPSAVTAAEPAINLDVSEGWNNLLHLLRRERPDSPLNGIIITVSAADLVGTRRKTPEEIVEQAELIRAFLDKARKVLAVRLPVHLLITRCDIMPGFRSFAETLPEARRDDIFGWANPAPLEKPFDPAAAEAGFVELRKSLESLHDEMLAAPPKVHDADGLFVFVSEFAEMHDPLRDFIAKLMPQGERRPSLFFRGVYFTGDASEFAAKAASARSDEEQATLHISIEATEAETHSLVFLRTLFGEKIFKEAGLARSAARFRVSRDVRVVVAQAAAIVIALLGGFGLWTSVNGFSTPTRVVQPGLKAESADLTRVLAGVAIDFDAIKRDAQAGPSDSASARLETNGAVISLVRELRSVSSQRIRSPFIPSSWFSPVPKTIDKSILDGVQTLLLPVARQRLQERVNRLLGAPGKPVPWSADDLDPSDPKSLVTYLAEVRLLSRNVARYNSLASTDSGSAAELGGLVDYLFGERPTDSSTTSPQFEQALKAATAPKLAISPAQSASVVTRAVGLVGAIADSATRQLASRSTTPRVDDDLRALRRIKALTELSDAKTGLVSTVADSSVIGLRAAKEVQDSIVGRLGVVAIRVLRDTLTQAAAEQRLRSVVGSLFATGLLDEVQGGEVANDLKAGQVLRWDIGQFELAFALRGGLKRAAILSTDAFPAATQARLHAAFEEQMRGRALDLIAASQRFVSDSLSTAAEMRTATENLSGASSRILHAAAMLDTLKASTDGRKLLALGARQAENVLALAQQMLDSANYFQPHPAVVAAWRGTIPVGFAALGVADSGAFTLKLSREQVAPMQALAALVGPALQYLREPVVAPSMITNPKLVADWRGIYAAAGPEPTTTSLASLHQFISVTMGALDVASCQTAAARSDTLRATASDWFLMRRRQFRETMIGRCGRAGSAAELASYDKIRALFVTRLAGHFPFVDSSKAAAAPDADPAAVRELYALYDAFAKGQEMALRADPRVGSGAQPAFTFLSQLAAARPFFATFVDSGISRKAPELALVVQPPKVPVDPTLEPRELHIGARMIPLDDSAHEAVWGFGEPVRITGPGGAKEAKAFGSTGWWGLVELAVLQHDVKIRMYRPDTKVELKVPIFPQVAPEIPRR